MLQKLRAKFILTNMLFVVIILSTVFVSVYFSTANRFGRDIEAALSQAVSLSRFNDMGKPEFFPEPPDGKFNKDKKKDDKHGEKLNTILSHVVDVAADGSISEPFHNRLMLSDDEMSQAVELALSKEELSGEIKSMSLSYQKRILSDGVRIAFIDTTYFTDAINDLVITSLVIGFFAISGFFVLSLYLSKVALKPVERAWTQQKQFVADASHELKTPLTVILANLSILRSSNAVDSKGKRWIESTDEEAKYMKKLVEDMLTLAQSDAELVGLTFGSINLSECIMSECLQFEALAYESGIDLSPDIEDGIQIQGDQTKITQLIKILLDNACKYTPKNGKISVQLKKDAKTARLLVKNTGTIPKDELAQVFDRFYRADKSRKNSGSFGLGLSIAHNIVSTHNGKITADSEDDTIWFKVLLPIES